MCHNIETPYSWRARLALVAALSLVLMSQAGAALAQAGDRQSLRPEWR